MSLGECYDVNKRRFCQFEQLAHRQHPQRRGKKSGDWEKNKFRSSENQLCGGTGLSFPVSYRKSVDLSSFMMLF